MTRAPNTTLKYWRMVRNCRRSSLSDSALDQTDQRRVQRVPDAVAEPEIETRRPSVAGRRHVDALAHDERDAAEHPPDRLGKALGRILRRRARVRGAAIPRRRSAQGVGGETMDDARGQRRRDDDEQENQQPVVRTAAFGDRNDREPSGACLRRHSAADGHARDRRESVDEETGKNSGDETQSGKSQHRREGETVCLVRALSRMGARPTKKGDAEGLGEARSRQRSRERQQRPDSRGQDLQAPRTATQGSTGWPETSAIRRRSR